ncbi:acyl-CoA dehydrogenase family protein [Brevibacillus choshinensis]|uniref:Acyl-CoA dehydrogenase family protein n=1 Tax=Brevibacillus choshinensis TaxID=54911 RepID=A0ABX7FM49_BRECH|nr:acyl-CoA dehydrogenase family protein [Brevibacillus choshinensis]QRG66719.1 acyl-CoA dehydrogenase family protein [Brevibacillus choshinensis]
MMQSQSIQPLTHDKAMELIREMVPAIRSRAALTEELRCQPKETIQAFRNAGLIRALMPKRWGGAELGIQTMYETTVELAKADPSAGWCYGLLVLHSWMLAYYSEEAQREVWGEEPDACIASSFGGSPANQVTRVDGGYLVEGEWGFSSGIDHSDWAMIFAHAAAGAGNGIDSQRPMMLLVPKRDFTIVPTWNTIAQRGTGSNHLRVSRAFVPEHRTIDMVAWCQKGEGPGSHLTGNVLYQYPLYAVIPVSLASALLGASLDAYELWREGIKGKATVRNARVADFTHQQIRVAEVSATLEAAQALFEKSLARLAADQPIDTYERLRLRRNYGFTARLCNQAVKTMMDSSGAGSMFEANPLQRYWRDVQASSMHITFNMDHLGEMFGKLELGLPLNQKDSQLS